MTAAVAASMRPIIARVAAGEQLDEADAEAAFELIMSGEATPAQVAGFLMALRVRGETVAEITGAARVMRAKMTRIGAPAGAIDVCGTGGDAQGTWNISTAVAFVVAGCGVAVAKHGNRALSSKSGAADVLGALGVNTEADLKLVQQALTENGTACMMAPRHNAAMRHVAGPRLELGTRTIFNLLGPLSNPAGVSRQLVGVFSAQWVQPLAEVLGRLGAEKAWVVHGSDGLDEVTTTGPTAVGEWDQGKVRAFEITPEEAGLPRAEAAALKGGDAPTNALALSAVLDGHPGPYRDIVLLNAAAALMVAGKARSLKEGVALAARSIESGAARHKLQRLIGISQGRG